MAGPRTAEVEIEEMHGTVREHDQRIGGEEADALDGRSRNIARDDNRNAGRGSAIARDLFDEKLLRGVVLALANRVEQHIAVQVLLVEPERRGPG